jgi:arylsulfatase A-like enzyme
MPFAGRIISAVFTAFLHVLQRRLPSGMQGDKTSAALGTFPSAAGSEGSLRNHLAVWGPGVPSGAVDNTLLTLADVLPTMAELVNASNTKHQPWSGCSFANLLAEGGKRRRSQDSRYHFVLAVSKKTISAHH